MAKPSEPKKPAAKSAAAKSGSAIRSSETQVSSKENPDPTRTSSGNAPSTRPKAQATGKASPSTKDGAKTGDHTEATGRDHPSQSEHAKALWEKLHGTSEQRVKGTGAPGTPPGQKRGFDPKQFKGGGKNFGGGGNQMLRRTQSRGGGGGSGGGSGGGGGGA